MADPLTELIVGVGGISVFLLGGLATALSPCLFPLLPLAIFRMQRYQRGRTRALVGALIIVSGILVSYNLFFLFARFLGSLLLTFLLVLYIPFSFLLGSILIIAGVIVIVPKLHQQLGRVRMPEGVNSLMMKEEYSIAELFLLGLLFSLIALPCSGAISLGLVGLAAAQNFSPILFALCLLAFSLGIAMPYIVLSLFAEEARLRLVSVFTAYSRYVQFLAGLGLILVGILVMLPVFEFVILNILSILT